MYIGDSEFKGQAPGPFVGLDLTEDLYIGAVPDFSRIARAAGFGNGFTGQSVYLLTYCQIELCRTNRLHLMLTVDYRYTKDRSHCDN